MSLQQIFAELREQFHHKDVMDRYAAAAGAVAREEKRRVLRVGDSVPPFKLSDPEVGELSSVDLLRHGVLIISFYRGFWCPYCQRDLLRLDAVMAEIGDIEASAVAVTRGLAGEARQRLLREHSFNFLLVNDVDGMAAESFGIRWSPEDSQLIEKELGMDVITLRDIGPWIFPMQARFVLAKDRSILFADVVFDYKQNSDASEMLSVLQSVQS
jgi:peroxiredoxin